MMNLAYKCGKDVINIINIHSCPKSVEFIKNYKASRCYQRKIRKDDNGEYFLWNKNKIYLKDWSRTSMKELKEKLEIDGHISSSELVQACLSDGIKNVRLLVPSSFFNEIENRYLLCKIKMKGDLLDFWFSDMFFMESINSSFKMQRGVSVFCDSLVSLISSGKIKIMESSTKYDGYKSVKIRYGKHTSFVYKLTDKSKYGLAHIIAEINMSDKTVSYYDEDAIYDEYVQYTINDFLERCDS